MRKLIFKETCIYIADTSVCRDAIKNWFEKFEKYFYMYMCIYIHTIVYAYLGKICLWQVKFKQIISGESSKISALRLHGFSSFALNIRIPSHALPWSSTKKSSSLLWHVWGQIWMHGYNVHGALDVNCEIHGP